jgi:NADH-quinone oxidoreductase subunit L
MMMGLGTGGVAVGMFHLITHAFFKALLFLGSGSVIHGCHEEQDIRFMGGLRKFMPITFATYAAGMLALCGFPLLFSGFWSKDDILHSAHSWPISHGPFYLGVFGALLTAFYMTRQVCYVFFGQYRGNQNQAAAHGQAHDHGHGGSSEPHESPLVMTGPLMTLAVFAVLLGFVGTPAWPWFQGFLSGHAEEGGLQKLFEGEVLGLILMSSGIVFLGLGLGWWFYGRTPVQKADETDALERLRPDIFALLHRKYFVDEIYEASVVRFNAWWAKACDFLDQWVWNGLVQLVSYLVIGLSWVDRVFDEQVINRGFDQGCESMSSGGGFLRHLQDGRVQHYLRILGTALVVIVLVLIWGCRAS